MKKEGDFRVMWTGAREYCPCVIRTQEICFGHCGIWHKNVFCWKIVNEVVWLYKVGEEHIKVTTNLAFIEVSRDV